MSDSKREPFDPSKLEVHAEMPEHQLSSGKASLFVSVITYDGGPLKVQALIGGTKKDGSSWRTSNLGSLAPADAEVLASHIMGCVQWIQEQEAPPPPPPQKVVKRGPPPGKGRA